MIPEHVRNVFQQYQNMRSEKTCSTSSLTQTPSSPALGQTLSTGERKYRFISYGALYPLHFSLNVSQKLFHSIQIDRPYYSCQSYGCTIIHTPSSLWWIGSLFPVFCSYEHGTINISVCFPLYIPLYKCPLRKMLEMKCLGQSNCVFKILIDITKLPPKLLFPVHTSTNNTGVLAPSQFSQSSTQLFLSDI